MEQTSKQQVIELIKASKRILILGSSGPTGDTVGSILALTSVLNNLEKKVSALISEELPENLRFLPFGQMIEKKLDDSSEFVIKVNVKDKPLDKLSYNKEGQFLNIILTTKEGHLEGGDVEFVSSLKYDLIIVLDTPDIDKIDRIYDKHTKLFFETPLINIDHHAGNEGYGTLNLVDLTATSTSEIMTALIDSLGTNLINEDVATCLLAGIIDDTSSFKNISTTPKSFTVSAQLLAAGARQQEIVDNLFKSKSLRTLKLWGKILDSLVSEDNLIWSAIDNKTYSELRASIEDIYGVINELLSTVPEANTVVIFVEEIPGETRIIIRCRKEASATKMSQVFGITGSKSEAVLQLMGEPKEIATKFFERLKNKAQNSTPNDNVSVKEVEPKIQKDPGSKNLFNEEESTEEEVCFNGEESDPEDIRTWNP
jgi:bifunctional oligoribonuclease and PAP phosphatase NrnA